jgi:hypothetical protein
MTAAVEITCIVSEKKAADAGRQDELKNVRLRPGQPQALLEFCLVCHSRHTSLHLSHPSSVVLVRRAFVFPLIYPDSLIYIRKATPKSRSDIIVSSINLYGGIAKNHHRPHDGRGAGEEDEMNGMRQERKPQTSRIGGAGEEATRPRLMTHAPHEPFACRSRRARSPEREGINDTARALSLVLVLSPVNRARDPAGSPLTELAWHGDYTGVVLYSGLSHGTERNLLSAKYSVVRDSTRLSWNNRVER